MSYNDVNVYSNHFVFGNKIITGQNKLTLIMTDLLTLHTIFIRAHLRLNTFFVPNFFLLYLNS